MKNYRCLFLVLIFVMGAGTINKPKAQTILNSVERKFMKYKASAPKDRVLVISDRDIYVPGDYIWINVAVYDIFKPIITGISKEVSVALIDHESRELFDKKLLLNRGRAKGFIKLPNVLTEGVYYLQGKTANSEANNYYFRKIVIRDKIVPPYIVKASFAEKIYIPGDPVNMTLEFRNYHNEPLRGVEYKVDFYDGKRKIPVTFGKTKKTGIAIVNAKIPFKLKSGMLSYRVNSDCKKGITSLKGMLPVLTDQIFIDFYPSSGKLIDGINSKVSCYVYNAAGKPIEVEAELLAEGSALSAFSTDINGLGSFDISPDEDVLYQVQLKRPLLLDKKYDLPEVHSKGIALREISRSKNRIVYQLLNGYLSDRSVYLIGVCGGEIFWTSEHEIEREEKVEIDISKINGSWVHLLALNAAEHIEGEQIVYLPNQGLNSIKTEIIEESFGIRGKNVIETTTVGAYAGEFLFSVVNSPWLLNTINNQNMCEIALPSDLGGQMVFQSQAFHNNVSNPDLVKQYKSYYIPVTFGWDKVLNTDPAFTLPGRNQLAINNLGIVDQVRAGNIEQLLNGIISQMNMTADSYFAISNPQYVQSLFEQKNEKKPAYKNMLENGTPVMDVLQVIKPYTLEGNNIVFYGGPTSINFQGGALIAIDGVNRGTDASVLANLSPYDIESMSASTHPSDIQRYTGLNPVGVVEVTLKKGEELVEVEEAIDEDQTFSAPEYKNEQGRVLDDFRSTLWWEYAKIESPGQKVHFTYFNSELFSKVQGKVYFIPDYGHPMIKDFGYTIK